MAPIQPVNQLPTPPSATSDRRSNSYTSHHDDTNNNINTNTNTTNNSSSTLGNFSPKPLPRSNMDMDMQIREYHNSIKATLTALLNDERVRQNPGSTQCVQAGLLETEQGLRREKRKSLGTAPPDEKL